jgi:dsRNA-specific ribonuclease
LKDQLLYNLWLVNASLTAPSTQLTINNERLKTYGDAVISLLYSIVIYLDREEEETEKVYDSLRK